MTLTEFKLEEGGVFFSTMSIAKQWIYHSDSESITQEWQRVAAEFFKFGRIKTTEWQD